MDSNVVIAIEVQLEFPTRFLFRSSYSFFFHRGDGVFDRYFLLATILRSHSERTVVVEKTRNP